jgi:hypothetical protein
LIRGRPQVIGTVVPGGHGRIVTDAHDGRPLAIAAAVLSGFAAAGVVRALMPETKQVSGLVRSGFGHIAGRAVTKSIGEHKAHVGGTVVEPADVSDSASRLAEPIAVVAADGNLGRAAVREIAGIDCGDVDVKRRIVFGHAGPDFLDAVEFGGAEATVIAIKIVDGRIDRGRFPTGGVAAVEI